MNKNLTDITVVIDRSGSMQSCRTDAEGGLNAFIKAQATGPGEALLSLVQFDTEYEFVHRGVPIKTVPRYILMPRGSTALYDAVGRAIIETGFRLAAMPEAERPGLVLFAIITDGQENSSKEFNARQVRSMIEHQKSKYDWQFTYLGANQDAFKEASYMGIDPDAVLNYDTGKSKAAMNALSAVSFRRRAAAANQSAAPSGFTKEERESSV